MATQQVKRSAYRTLLGGLSLLTGYGAFYHFTKYSQSNRHWNAVSKSIQEFQPIEIKGQDAVQYPWLAQGELNNWEYKVVKIQGWFREERFFVRRQRDGKEGYLVFAPFITSTRKLESEHNSAVNPQENNTVFVNLGWVPLENKLDIEMTGEPVELNEAPEDELDIHFDRFTNFTNDPEPYVEEDTFSLTTITALVRKGETQNILQGRRNWPSQGVFQYIDLDYMARFFRVFNLDGARAAYLERIVPDYDEEESELYPVPASKDNFEQPLQTPSSHLSKFYFLGGTSALSIISALSLLKR
ncbi:hypothetical protein PPERSA_04528 [Pseudocohnilembus persalinus]|uniref:SURF1-like protein n=1 Tax=Pseudocohnilembus persalinus TaxID=266149 RepID=A0A0V0QT02_PSEPJ|nr:hypothetical protein PPERSA_04528 [Pseudocohnilembus persalinus]|eukprot:KRX05491.1 hypothetical protein PPERSA_04528 [Pseudocohnilembus persalinus]